MLIERLVHGTYAWMISDTAFKRCFGSDEFKEATIGLLNSVIPNAGIKDVTFIKTEIQGLSVKDRKGFNAFEKAAIISSYTQEEMLQYEKDMVTELDRKLELEEARDKAFAKGVSKGRAEGQDAVIRSLLASGMSAEQIARITNISKEHIATLL